MIRMRDIVPGRDISRILDETMFRSDYAAVDAVPRGTALFLGDSLVRTGPSSWMNEMFC
jgi:hypothetical protein